MKDPGAAEKPSEFTIPALELRPHPCTFPLPESVTVRGITCVTRTFLVDFLPAIYPYLPFRCSNSPTAKFQIPFFSFSGPDPPPPDIGSPGDVYVAPAANALYAYLPVDGVSDRGAWTRWSFVRSEYASRELKLSEPGVFGHPLFPAHVLWAVRTSFGWYSLSTVNSARRDVRSKKLFADGEGVEAASKILVAYVLQQQEEKVIDA